MLTPIPGVNGVIAFKTRIWCQSKLRLQQIAMDLLVLGQNIPNIKMLYVPLQEQLLSCMYITTTVNGAQKQWIQAIMQLPTLI